MRRGGEGKRREENAVCSLGTSESCVARQFKTHFLSLIPISNKILRPSIEASGARQKNAEALMGHADQCIAHRNFRHLLRRLVVHHALPSRETDRGRNPTYHLWAMGFKLRKPYIFGVQGMTIYCSYNA